MNPDPFDALRRLYAEVDDRHTSHECPGTTECCRFGITGREPYVTSVELAYLRRAVDRAPLPRARSLPVAGEEPCPILRDGRCGAYAARPFGCRTFWCDRATSSAPVRHAETLDWVRRLREIAARHEAGGDQGRPLRRALATSPSRRGGTGRAG